MNKKVEYIYHAMIQRGSGKLPINKKMIEEVLYFLDEYHDEELYELFEELERRNKDDRSNS